MDATKELGMNAEILVNVTPMETRVAMVENGILQEVYIERSLQRGIVGNIYKGRVVRVLPGMQAAFIDIGLAKAAFIHVADIHLPQQSKESAPAGELSIGALVREGQSLIVQVIKEPLGAKGARLTTQLSIPSRYLVFMPKARHIGVSQRIEEVHERERLRELVAQLRESEDMIAMGYIVRTAAEGVSSTELGMDMNYLKRLWRVLKERMLAQSEPSLVYEDVPLHNRVFRDYVHAEVEKVRIDSQESFQSSIEFVNKYTPQVANLLEYYSAERPLFDLFAVEDELQRALDRKVELKSGGYLIIDQTEAMTTIDVNTGAFVGSRNLEETIFKTNLEAVSSLVRQLRLRNLGGIIIIDFIDMDSAEHRRQVLRLLEKMLERDHAKSKLTGVSELGLVEMTRKRTRESLWQMMMQPCPVCDGRGRLKTAQTVCYELFREILRAQRAYDSQGYLILASQAVVDRLLDEESANVADLENCIGKPIQFSVETTYSQEQYDVVLQS